ncbi:acetyltransferase, GNAT superfamily protein [Acanthamoeba castellanii str. Neff]|uniref:Acetyltransferase, GNAT superfamily protein n=1 Tax=Acanthamoeba castellanii (strain ATCC 30010 / Neff) TaxID=1257118 RepID=L8GQ50_ACACF|nr:acetyltransferase, GNAT superfamily protein [Acanthamoeba castellanii str. Neff]ELR15090.1 acetyltransferase, GNAT superfamily protein [Acanthamoeba castellanii str. Neff]
MMDIVVVQREEMDEEEEESSRGWVYQYDAVSTRGHRHRVAVRVLHGHDTDELNRLVVVDRQLFGSSSWSLKCFARYIRRMHGAGFVAEINGEVAGFVLHIATSKRGVAEVANVGVLEEFRQMGIASTLLRLALDDLASRGYHTVKLHVASQNVAAQSLYLKMGFVQTGYKEDYYWQDQDRDAVVMRLQLLPLLPETEVSCCFL